MESTCRFLDNGQAQTSATILFARVEAMKHAKNLLLVAGLDPDTVVAYKELTALTVYRKPPELNPSTCRMIEFDCVSDEILKELREKGRVRLDGGPLISHRYLHIWGQGKGGYQFLEKDPNIYGLRRQTLFSNPGEFQHVFHQDLPLANRPF